MAETAVLINPDRTVELERESELALFHRRIEFHQARKPFTGFGNNSSEGFKLVTLNPSSEPHVASVLGKKSEKSSEFFETGLDPELNFEISFRRIGAGLRNLGNTCFLNSVLQCLTYTEPLAAYLQSGRHQNSCCTAGFCALCAIQKHVSRALQSTGKVLEPKDLVSNLRRISRSFRSYNQEDAHEYMVYLLESMHKCCIPSGVPSESPSAYEKSLVHKIFGGRLRSQVKCMQCSYCSNKFDPFLDLSLEIAKTDSLRKALAHFTAEEQLDGGAREYQCQQCKQKVQALKNLTIYKAPHVLTVHLKRFRAYAPGQKIDKKVAFESTLDLKPFVSGPYEGNLNYTLYGVLVHAGWSTRCGHYYCFVRTSSGMWYSLDDNNVVQVNEKTVLAQKAYMLFYVRDRKKMCPKKPVAVMPNKNIVMNGIRNAADKIQNGSNEKMFSSVALSGSDAIVAAVPGKIPSEKTSSPNTNGAVAVDNLGNRRDSKTGHSPVLPPTTNPSKQHPVMGINSLVHEGESCSTVDCSGDTVKIMTCNNRSSVEEQKTSAISDTPHDPLYVNESSDLILMPSGCNNNANSKMCASKIMPVETMTRPSNKANNISQQNVIEESQVGDSSVNTADPSNEETFDNERKIDDAKSKELSGLPATTEPLPHEITMNRRAKLKVRRKLFKCQIRTTSLSSNIILGEGPCIRKKKHKRRRNSVQKASNVTHLSDPSNLGRSISEEAFPSLTDHQTDSQKEKTQCSSESQIQKLSIKNKSGKDSTSIDVIGNEFRGRVVQNGTTPSDEKPSGNCGDELRQIDVMSILTRGMDEITVARWDDMSLSQKTDTRAAKPKQIGHIGDEWDEEYDRGKRKKIRGPKISFGGPNLFQEIATKRKRPNVER